MGSRPKPFRGRFVVIFTSFKEEFDRDGATAHLLVRVESELMRWLTSHIKSVDTQLAVCVKAPTQ